MKVTKRLFIMGVTAGNKALIKLGLNINGIKIMEYSYDLSKYSTTTFREYILKLMGIIGWENRLILLSKLLKSRAKSKVQRKLSDRTILRLKAYILPWDVSVVSKYGIPTQVLTVSNSAIVLREAGNVGVFLRLGGVNFSRTFIAYTEIPINNLRSRVKVNAKVVLPPILSSECVEDPRVDPDNPNNLYHVRAYYTPRYRVKSLVITFRTETTYGNKEVRLLTLKPILFEEDKKFFIVDNFRDSFPLSRSAMVIRPWFEEAGIGGIFVGQREDEVVSFKTLEPIPELAPLPNVELKTGGNASVKISSNEYLLIFHSVEHPHGMYYTFAALFSNSGELLGVTPEPIISPYPDLYSGRRPSTIFVCGAVKIKDRIIISAGKDDEILVFFEGELSKILDSIKYIKG